jgi:hypothetical protein
LPARPAMARWNAEDTHAPAVMFISWSEMYARACARVMGFREMTGNDKFERIR